MQNIDINQILDKPEGSAFGLHFTAVCAYCQTARSIKNCGYPTSEPIIVA